MNVTLEHYKNIVLEKIVDRQDPNDRHIKEWTSSHIQVNRLLKQMQKEGLLKIEMVHDDKTVRRVLTPLVEKIIPEI
jgi:hypothetical protein